jgi:hypothetical protein
MSQQPILPGPWSFSRVSSCSLQHYREKVLKDTPSGRPDDSFGTDRTKLGHVLHTGAETMIKALRKFGKWPSPKKLTSKLLAMPDYRSMSEEVAYIEDSLAMFPEQINLDVDQLLDQELEIGFDSEWNSVNFWKAPATGWRAKIDLAQMRGDRVKVTDYKNRPAMFSEAELKIDQQLSLYAFLLAKRYPQVRKCPDVELGIYYFQFGVDQSIILTWDQVDDNVRKLQARAAYKESLKEDDIGPEPGFGKCQYCHYINDCPSGSGFLGKGGFKITNHDQVVALAKKVFVVGEWNKAARAAINKYSKENGEVMIDSGTGFGNVLVETVSYEAEDVRMMLEKNGLSVDGVFNVDKAALKKLVGKDKAVQDQVDKLKIVKPGTKFKEFKPVKAKVKGKNRDSE